VTDHRDEHEAYAITPPPAVAEFQTRIAQLLAEAQSKVSMALESSRLSEDEVRRLRARCEMEASHIAELKDQISSLRVGLAIALDQRDLHRREVCYHRAAAIQDRRPEDIAAALQWDCFRESPLDRLAKMDEENGL
jgi:hypothetical protein